MALQRSMTGERIAPARRSGWRISTTAIPLTVLTSLLLACAPPASPAATSAPAPTAVPAAKPAEASPQTSPARPATAAQPIGSPAVAVAQPAAQSAGPASGQIVIVIEAEPDTIVPKDGSSNLSHFVLDNVYDQLVAREWSSSQSKIVPQLAESWARFDDHTWRFKLRHDVRFTNGEVFNADAVVTAVLDMADPQQPGRGAGEYGTLQSAKKIDDFTADIITKDPDPILPERLVHFPIAAPNWVKTASPETIATQAVGSGPYLLADYQKGQYLLFKANPNYWGPNKPKIAEIKYVGRSEPGVRAAMLQAGEADLAFNITLDQAKQAPRTIIEQTQESPIFRINGEHPVLKDVRVRQAIAEAIDTQGMINSLYPGGIGVPLQGQLVRQGTLGWNPNLKPYPYKPDEAKQLMQAAGAVGTPIEYVDRVGFFPHSDEVADLIVNQLNQIGFKASSRRLEAASFIQALRAVKPDQQRSDLQVTSVSSPILDSSRIFDIDYACGGRNRMGCDPEFDRRYAEAKVLTGDARDKAFQALWEYEYDKYLYVPLFGLNWAHGASARLQWTPRLDGVVLFSEMALNP
jgi:peptide/nickel transport system substrate-binding protein